MSISALRWIDWKWKDRCLNDYIHDLSDFLVQRNLRIRLISKWSTKIKKSFLKTDFENPVYLFSSFHLKTWSRWFEVTRLFTIFLFIIYFGCWEIESNLLSFTRNVRPAGCQGSTWTRALIFEALEPRVNLIILNVQSQLNDNSSKIFSRYRKIFHGRDRGDGQSRV